MKIERFRVQNYKNLKDVTVEGLSDINVFFGQNSVGKSNTFEALASRSLADECPYTESSSSIWKKPVRSWR